MFGAIRLSQSVPSGFQLRIAVIVMACLVVVTVLWSRYGAESDFSLRTLLSQENKLTCQQKAVLLASKDNRDGSWGPHNLTSIREDYSETGDKTKTVFKLLNSKKGGVFLEAGAFDGEEASVSLGLELHHNWKSILLEPVPWLFSKVVKKNRRAFHVQGCLSPTNEAGMTQFTVDQEVYTSSGVVKGRYKYAAPIKNTSKLVDIHVMCYPLMDVVKAAGYKKLDVLYLDVQGAELDILKTIQFEELEISLIAVENSQDSADKFKKSVLAILEPHGFRYALTVELDLIFVNNKAR